MGFNKSDLKIGQIITLNGMGKKELKITSLVAEYKGEIKPDWFKAVRFIKTRNEWSSSEGICDIKNITSIK